MRNTVTAARFVGAAFLFLTVGLWAPPLSAQRIAPPPQRWLGPQLVISSSVDIPIRLQQVALHAELSGNLAISEIELTFYNPNRRVLEGELQFPLLDGQEVQSFAMDVNGKLREAVPVDKTRGQTVFEDITRVRIDPALLQKTQGNNFKLRVYPIPAQGTKVVVIRYAETLRERGDRRVFQLPLEYASDVGSFRLDLGVQGVSAPPLAVRGLEDLKFVRSGGGFHAQAAREHFTGRGVLEIEVAPTRGVQASTQAFDGRTYFYAEVPVPVRSAPRIVPRVVGLVWDSSGSGASRDHVREFALLDAYFRQMRNGEVQLTRIRDAAESQQVFKVADGDWSGLRTALEATPYDGATNLGAFEADARAGEYLLFSDGLSNFGDKPFPAVKVPVYAVSSSSKSDPPLLRQIAKANGGRYIDLLLLPPAQAASALLNAGTRVSATASDGATELMLRSPYPQNGRIEIAGVLTERSTHLRLDLLHPGGERATIEVPLRAGEAPFALAAPLWARLKIESLEAQYELNRGEIRRLGQNFRLVTRETSLIVLDRVEDYARYEIAPPAELMADYEKLRQMAAQRSNAERGGHLENIVRRFGDKVAWWNKDFPQDITSPSRDLQIAAPTAESSRGFNSQLLIEQQARRNTVASERPPIVAPEVMLAPPRPGNAPMATIGIRGTAGGAPDDATEAQARVAPPPPASPLPMRQQNAIARLGIAANNVESKKALAESGETGAVIQLKKWEPDAAYASRLHATASDTVYRIYLDERPSYLASTAFFLDVADILFDKGQPALAQRVLSNLAEMDLENRQILRVLGYRLLQAQKPALAIPVFRKVLELSPAEPQSYRDLGLALAANGQYQEAVDTLYEVIIRPWDNRFPDIELTALAEMNAIIATHGPLDVSRFDSRLSKNLPLDLRVVLTWDADNTDIDLWVTDPNGEKAFYSHPLTYQGGRMSADFTGGYGPEEFSLKRAKPGKYKVEAQYFGDNRQIVMGATTLQVRLATKFGSDRQKEKSITLRLKDRKESIFVGEFEVK